MNYPRLWTSHKLKSLLFSPTMAEGIQSDSIAHIRLDESDIQAISTIVELTVTAEIPTIKISD